MTNYKKPFVLIISLFSLANLFSYCLFHIPYFIIMEEITWLNYLRIFVSKFFDFLMPIVSATLLFLGYSCLGVKKTLFRGFLLSLTRSFYILPYYYAYFWVLGNDSIEAILLSALVTLFGIAVFFGESVLLLYIIRKFSRLPILRRLKINLPLNMQKKIPKDTLADLNSKADAEIAAEISDSPFDFSSPITFGILWASFAEFCISFLFEISEIIAYLVEYVGDYRIDDIIFYTVLFLFLAIEFISSYLICCYIKYFIRRKKAESDGINKTLE